MENNEILKNIKDLIANNMLEKSLQLLEDNYHSNKKIYNEIISIKGRLSALKQDSIKGIISSEEGTLKINQIRKSILDLIDKIERNNEEKYPQKRNAHKYVIIGMIALSVIIILAKKTFLREQKLEDSLIRRDSLLNIRIENGYYGKILDTIRHFENKPFKKTSQNPYLEIIDIIPYSIGMGFSNMAFLDITIKNNSIHDCNLTRIKFLIKEHTAFYYDPDPCPTCLKHSFSATYNISLENIKRNDVPEYGISNSIIPWGTERIGLLLGGQKLSYHSKFSIAFKYNREFEVESDVIEIIALNGQYNGIEKQKYILNDTLMYTGYHDFPSSILLRDSINKMIENNAVPIINQKMLKDILEPKSKSYHKLEEGWKKDKYSQIIDSLFKEK